MNCMFGVYSTCVLFFFMQVLLSKMPAAKKGGKKIEGVGEVLIVSKITYVGLIGHIGM